MGTISQRISLEGSEDIRKSLLDLGKAGEQAFKQIQDAASKPIADPAQIQKTKEAVDGLVTSAQSLAKQFQPLNDNIQQFGQAGAQATQQVTTGLNQTNTAAQQAGATIQQAGQKAATAGENAGSGLLSASTKFGIAAAGIVAALSAIASSLIKGTAETSKQISDQASALNVSIPQMQQLRTAMQGTSVASKDLGGSLGNVADLMAKGAGASQFLTGSLRQQTIEVKDGFVTISGFGMSAKDRLFEMRKESSKAATELRKLGASGEAIATGDTLRAMREIAANIDRQTDATKKAQIGTRAFKDNWEETTQALIESMSPIDRSTASLAELGKLNRQLSAGDVGLGKAFTAQTNQLSSALKAAKDQIGALFLGPATAKAKWMTDLVDGAAELFRQFTRLDQLSREGFLKGLSEGPAQTAFKILVALGQQLAAIWTGVLVPAGQSLVGIIGRISGSLTGVSTAQVVAGFIAAAAAVTGLAIAFKGLSFVTAPLIALFSLFSSFGPILLVVAAAVIFFWDTFKSAALSALELIPNAMIGFRQALEALLQGDFQSFWGLFAASALVAFGTIKQAILQADGVLNDFMRALAGEQIRLPWIQTFVNGLKQIGSELPGTIELIVKGLNALGNAATFVADTINRMFGTKLTGTALVLILIIAQFTGVLGFLATAAVLAGGALAVLVNALRLVGLGFGFLSGAGAIVMGLLRLLGLVGIGATAAFAGIPILIGAAIIALGTLAVALIAFNWDAIKAGAQAAWDAIKSGAVALKDAVLNAWEGIRSGASSLWETLKTGAASAWQGVKDALTLIISPFIDWEKIKQGATEAKTAVDAFAAALNAVNWAAFEANGVKALDAILKKLAVVLEELQKLSGLGGGGVVLRPVGGDRGGQGVTMAGGGLLGGRGTGTSDSNLAWLSRGEHVMPARAVRQPGVLAFLEALRRSGGDLSRVADRMGHFALGGLMPRPMMIPAFAAGGLAGGNNVTIQFPGLPEIGGLRASSDVVDQLRKAAAMAQVRSGGRKPSRYS